MRAARIATSPEGSTAPQTAPLDAAPVQETAVRIAAGHDLASASPVHVMQAEIERAFHRGARTQGVRWTFDPVRLALLVYTVGFWWGVFALSSAIIHRWPR
ncbi:MAG: hypothetical protein WDN45_01185 [Caulobacteraceae bacterium]